jgi:hypothetical protein
MNLLVDTRNVLMRWMVAGALFAAAAGASAVPAMAQSSGDGGSSSGAAMDQPADTSASDADQAVVVDCADPANQDAASCSTQAQATDTPAAPVHVVVTAPGGATAPSKQPPAVSPGAPNPYQGLPTGC